MKFGIIDPTKKTTTTVEAKEFADALVLAGLKRGEVDHHDIVASGLGIVVFEFGLFAPAHRQSYFAIGGQLYGGNAVLYAYDELGVSIDFKRDDWADVLNAILWFDSAADVEAAIAMTVVQRPQIAVNGEVGWQWPAAAPPGMGARS